MSKQSQAVAEMKSAPPAVIDDVVDFERMAGAGQEAARSEDFAIPFIGVLQALSPQLKKTESAYIKGAEEGMIWNSVTNELWTGEDGIDVVPCYFQHVLVEFKKREDGGGLVAIHPATAIIPTERDQKNRDITERNTQIVNTMQFFCLVKTGEGMWERAVLSFKSTQLKKARRWNVYIAGRMSVRADGSQFQLPMFSHMYHFSTAPESNNEGSWYGWKFEMVRRLDEKAADRELVAHAVAFYRLAKAGDVKVTIEEEDGVGGAPAEHAGEKF